MENLAQHEPFLISTGIYILFGIMMIIYIYKLKSKLRAESIKLTERINYLNRTLDAELEKHKATKEAFTTYRDKNMRERTIIGGHIDNIQEALSSGKFIGITASGKVYKTIEYNTVHGLHIRTSINKQFVRVPLMLGIMQNGEPVELIDAIKVAVIEL